MGQATQRDAKEKLGQLYEEIHKHFNQNPRALKRLRNLLTTTYLDVPHNYFDGKVCLDAGCGATGRAMWSMVQMAAAEVYGIDLDPGYIEPLLAVNGEITDKLKLHVGSVVALPYDDDFFDFVHCDGVLHHCPGESAYQGFRELARVTKPGGMLYVTASGKGGILNWVTRPVHSLASKVDPMRLERALSKVLSDSDKLTTIISTLCPPVYEYRFTEAQVRGWFEKLGFTEVMRITRYPQYDNYRQYLAPFYYNYHWLLSRALYGEGYIQMRGIKRR